MTYTQDNSAEDAKLYENIKRIDEETKPLDKRGAKGAAHTAARKILKGVNNILEELVE